MKSLNWVRTRSCGLTKIGHRSSVFGRWAVQQRLLERLSTPFQKVSQSAFSETRISLDESLVKAGERPRAGERWRRSSWVRPPRARWRRGAWRAASDLQARYQDQVRPRPVPRCRPELRLRIQPPSPRLAILRG